MSMKINSRLRRSAAIAVFLAGTAALADPITATVSGAFENSAVLIGQNVTSAGGCFSEFHDNFACVGFSGKTVTAEIGAQFVAGLLSFAAEPQTAGNVYITQLVLTTDAADPQFQGPATLQISIVTGQTVDRLEFSGFQNAGHLEIPVDGSSTQAELLFKFGSLDFIGFGNISGSGALVPNAVPEPSSFALVFLAGLALVLSKRAASSV